MPFVEPSIHRVTGLRAEARDHPNSTTGGFTCLELHFTQLDGRATLAVYFEWSESILAHQICQGINAAKPPAKPEPESVE